MKVKTPRAKWLGGFKKNGEKYSTFDALKEHLEPTFEWTQKALDMPLIRYENERKRVLKTLHVSVWKKH